MKKAKPRVERMNSVARMLVAVGRKGRLVPMDVEIVGPGVGKIPCLECEGRPEDYPSLFPDYAGITECVDCKGTGWVYISV